MTRVIAFALVSALTLTSQLWGSERNERQVHEEDTAGKGSMVSVNPLRNAYYGDLHLHTVYSFDAYLMGTGVMGPDEAYRFARGEVVDYLGQPIKRRNPLDFTAVTDHAESIGVFDKLDDPNSLVSRSEVGKGLEEILISLKGPDGRRDFERLSQLSKDLQDRCLRYLRDYFVLGSKNLLPDELKAESASAWRREIEIANRNYEPGKFTTFIAYEWTAQPIHRNVIFQGDSAPYPFTCLDSKRPEDLWVWLKSIRKKGYEALAIPHNGNFFQRPHVRLGWQRRQSDRRSLCRGTPSQ